MQIKRSLSVGLRVFLLLFIATVAMRWSRRIFMNVDRIHRSALNEENFKIIYFMLVNDDIK